MASNLQQYRLSSIRSTNNVNELLTFGHFPCQSSGADCWKTGSVNNTPSYYMVPFGQNQDISKLDWTHILPKEADPATVGKHAPCANLNLDMSAPVLENYEFLLGIIPQYASSGAYNDNNANVDEVYLASRSYGLVRYNPTLGNCSVPLVNDMDYGVINTTEHRNRALSAMATSNIQSAAYIYGGINTDTNGTLSVSDELWALVTTTNEWASSTNNTQHQIPPLHSAVIFETTNIDPLGTGTGFLYLIGGCNTTATAFNPTDVTGCLPMDKVYQIGVSTLLPTAAEVYTIQGWIPPITKSFCSTFIPNVGLFVSGGYQAPAVAGGPPTINTASWLLTTVAFSGSFAWKNVTIENPQSLSSLPTVGHDCLFSAEQILFIGSSSSTDGSGNPPPISVVNIQRPATYNGTATFSRGSVLNQPADFNVATGPSPAKKWPMYVGIAAGVVVVILAVVSVMVWKRRKIQQKQHPHPVEMKPRGNGLNRV